MIFFFVFFKKQVMSERGFMMDTTGWLLILPSGATGCLRNCGRRKITLQSFLKKRVLWHRESGALAGFLKVKPTVVSVPEPVRALL